MAYENWTVLVEFADWVDVTADVDTITSPINATSGETTEADDAAGSATIVLRNPEQRYTPGNVLSDLYPYVRSGRRLRIQETIGDRTYDIFTGRLAWPDVESWVKSSTTEPREQSITLNAVDLVAQLDNAATFVSTLAAHITWAGGTSLVGYWPLGDAAEPVQSYPSGQSLRATQAQYGSGAVDPTDPSLPSLNYRGAPPLPGDDLAPIDFQPSRDITFVPTEFIRSYTLKGTTSYTISAGQVMTLVAWIRPDELYRLGYVFALNASPGFAAITWDFAGAVLRGVAGDGVTWDGEILGAHPGYGRWVPVGLRCGFNPDVLELWIGGDVYTGSTFVSGGATTTWTSIDIGTQFDGAIAHVQVYIGNPDDWTYAHFLAQRQVGLYGLERQTTGERIRSVLRYAGIAETDMTHIDPGVAVMQRALMADRTPGALVGEAVATERGSFYADGANLPVFDDRRTLYNN